MHWKKYRRHNLTIVSEDPVAADIVGAEILGHKHVFHLSKALERKLGEKPEVIRLHGSRLKAVRQSELR